MIGNYNSKIFDLQYKLKEAKTEQEKELIKKELIQLKQNKLVTK